MQELSTGSSILPHSLTGKRLGWIPVVEDRRKKKERTDRRKKEGVLSGAETGSSVK